jgi:hypothetical protein
MNIPSSKSTNLLLPALLVALLLAGSPWGPVNGSAQNASQGGVPSPGDRARDYKMISGFKQQFSDDLQSHLAKGWRPYGGVSVTTWNGNLYFAQMLRRFSSQ